MSVLQVDHLIKKYGRLTAVNGLNLEIQAGQVFGILGPNGSGKTTTLGMVLGVTQPTSGSFSWFGKGGGADVRKRIGAILERPVFYPYMDAEQNLRLSSLIREVDPTVIDQVLDMVGLLHRKKDAFKGYSLGMKQTPV
ncbi:MAG: ATP-binding cassette domain-containing protein, partial [Flavobacteriales bacterium]|nr:ATP-binding cassette domain-containing protein [Flavobacteriales bacterium]